MSLPVLDAIRKLNSGDTILNSPHTNSGIKYCVPGITVMTSPQAKEIFKDSPYINKLIIYDKHLPLRRQISLFFELKKENFDLVVDLRNTLFGALLPARMRTSPFLRIPSGIQHAKDRNLYRLKIASQKALAMTQGESLFINQSGKDYINGLLEKNNIRPDEKIVIIAPVTGGANRRWEKEKFAQVARDLSKDYKVILVGRAIDKPVTQYICDYAKGRVFDFSGLTNILQLAYLLSKASLVLVCDTGVLQLASYMDAPILALFGASDEKRFGPWTKAESRVVCRELSCRRCHRAQCPFGTVDCMRFIKAEEVIRQAKDMLQKRGQIYFLQKNKSDPVFKRILIVRTDRIGDVVLSTPVIKALRDNYPNAYIAMMVRPYTKDIVEANPYLDEVIIYDKEGRHKSWQGSFRFAMKLRKKRFDLALILHPTNRVHLITFFAGITKRVGYNRKFAILLTDRITHTKQFGEKHELEYNLDLVRYLGIEVKEKSLFVPVKAESEKWADELLKREGIINTDKILVIHPGASCPSKIWPNERFAEVADKLIEEYKLKVVIVAGPKDISLAGNVLKKMQHPAVNLAGTISLAQLISIIKRAKIFISNDSGPVHIASALGVPVISIFGRNQRGLSSKRWGPVGAKDLVLHKEVGCIQCLAHNCLKEFFCLKAISVADVLSAAKEIL